MIETDGGKKMAKQEIEISWRAVECMREVLLDHGFVAAEHAEPERIAKKIQNWWPGGVAAFCEYHDVH